jgi:polysaccharide pyruvyl transferase WcaK-like protein
LVFDYGRGVRETSMTLESGRDYRTSRVGVRGGRRYYARENLATISAFSALGSRIARLHPTIRLLNECSAVLDVSAGDSFSDIYGSHRFWSIVRPKILAKQQGIPLILLPQTFGPFEGAEARRVAREAVLSAKVAWARDRRSFENLKRLVGSDFDESRHLEGVDMAFKLSIADPGKKLEAETRAWLEERERGPLVGLNVSGLIGLKRNDAKRQFGLKANYVETLVSTVETILDDPNVRLILVPHAMSPVGSSESDAEACSALVDEIGPRFRGRIKVSPRTLDEREVKWLISHVDWFCGTRMHSTIAALSSCVPAAAIAYSDKTLGVFESCGVGNQVFDPRALDTKTVVAKLVESFESRDETRERLARQMDSVKARATEQFESTVAILKELG